jgi:hypothetical protein
MTRAEILTVTAQASEHSMTHPLHLVGLNERFRVPAWRERPITAAAVVALMVFGLWVLCNEDERLASSLLDDWPEIRQVQWLTQSTDCSNFPVADSQ